MKYVTAAFTYQPYGLLKDDRGLETETPSNKPVLQYRSSVRSIAYNAKLSYLDG